jgi:hypothetical protein
MASPLTATLTLGQLIGRGSYGVVHRGRLNGKDVAVKIVPLDGTGAAAEVRKEVRLMRTAAHECAVELLAEFEHQENAWLVLELCEVGSVADLLLHRGGSTLTEPQVAAVCSATARGLAHLHDRCNLVHRDIKAGNLLLTAKGQVKLADFGIARATDGAAAKGTTIGSPLWMAPEMIEEGRLDAAVDIWALGITLIEMAEGAPPLAHLRPQHYAMFRIVTDPPPKLQESELWSTEFIETLAMCLRKPYAERPPARKVAALSWCRQASSTALLPLCGSTGTAPADAPMPADGATQMAVLPSLLGDVKLDGLMPVCRVIGRTVAWLNGGDATDTDGTDTQTNQLESTSKVRDEPDGTMTGRRGCLIAPYEEDVPMDATVELESTIKLASPAKQTPPMARPPTLEVNAGTLGTMPRGMPFFSFPAAPSTPTQADPPTPDARERRPIDRKPAVGMVSPKCRASLVRPLPGGRSVVTHVRPSTIAPSEIDAFAAAPCAFVSAALRSGKSQADIARFVLASGAAAKSPLGTLIAAPGPDGEALLDATLVQIDLEPYSFDEALRYTLDQCRLPTEPREDFARALQVLLACFGRAFTGTFPGYFAPRHGSDAVSIRANAAHDAQSAAMLALLLVKAPNLTLEQFLEESTGLRARGELKREWLHRLHSVSVRKPVQLNSPATHAVHEHRGWLLKEPRSGRSTNWRKRWCVLACGELRMYRAKDDGSADSIVQLASMRVRAGSSAAMRNRKEVHARSAFELFPASTALNAAAFEQGLHRRYVFAAESPAEQQAWIAALREALEDVSPASGMVADEAAAQLERMVAERELVVPPPPVASLLARRGSPAAPSQPNALPAVAPDEPFDDPKENSPRAAAPKAAPVVPSLPLGELRGFANAPDDNAAGKGSLSARSQGTLSSARSNKGDLSARSNKGDFSSRLSLFGKQLQNMLRGGNQ